MATKKGREVQWGKAKDTGVKASKTDEQKDAVGRGLGESRDSRRNPKDIKARPGGNTRNLDPNHILDLAESISALGLLQPIAIDKNSRLVAGEHRLEACKLLALDTSEARASHWTQILSLTEKAIKKADEEAVNVRLNQLNSEAYLEKYKDFQIPVLVLPLDAEDDEEAALIAETAENEKRQNYTKEEIQALAARLKKVGYIDKNGRPKKGEKSVKKALTVISGKSIAQIERDLRKTETPSHDGVFNEQKELMKIYKALERFIKKAPENKFTTKFSSLIGHIDKDL
jgi:hypothetical protein